MYDRAGETLGLPVATILATPMTRPRKLWSLLAFLTVMLVPALALADEGPTLADWLTAALASGGVLVAAAISFAGGLATSATPCVWPMIGITVSVFGAQEAKSRTQAATLSGVFVLGMAVTLYRARRRGGEIGRALRQLLSNKLVVGFIAVVLWAWRFDVRRLQARTPGAINNRLATVGGIGYGGAFALGS